MRKGGNFFVLQSALEKKSQQNNGWKIFMKSLFFILLTHTENNVYNFHNCQFI